MGSPVRERAFRLSGPEVLALRANGKTQFRRPIQPQPYVDGMGNFCWKESCFGQNERGPLAQAIASPVPVSKAGSSRAGRVLCPYGRPGDRLWVQETWAAGACAETLAAAALSPGFWRGTNGGLWYAADGATPTSPVTSRGRWRSSTQLPRWGSRDTLELVFLRVERLQDIDAAGAEAEGVTRRERVWPWSAGYSMDWSPLGKISRFAGGIHPRGKGQPLTERDIALGDPRCAVMSYWDSIYASRGFGSDSNPWVWVLTARRLEVEHG